MSKNVFFSYLKNQLILLRDKLNLKTISNEVVFPNTLAIPTQEDIQNQKPVFTKVYLPYSSDYSKKNLISRSYDTLLVNGLCNGIDISINQGEWDIVFSHLYSTFHLYGALEYYESLICNSFFKNLQANGAININDFLNGIIIPGDLGMGKASLTNYSLRECFEDITNDLAKYMVDNIEQYIYK